MTGLYASDIEHWWPDAEPFVARALERGDGEWIPEDIYACLKTRDMQAWAAVDDGLIVAVMVTQIVCYPRKRYCDLVLCSGERMNKWLPAIEMIKAWAVSQKCHGIRLFGRKGWLKALNMKEVYTVMVGEV